MTWLNRTAYSGAELQFVTAQQLLYRRQDAETAAISVITASDRAVGQEQSLSS
jgi:hypothetical protein